MTREVLLTRGKTAIVDDADYAAVMAAGPWHAAQSREGRWYAARTLGTKPNQKTQRLHTFLTGYAQTDHIDRDGLRNTRGNLRATTYTENQRNKSVRRDNRSGFKGVSRNGRR